MNIYYGKATTDSKRQAHRKVVEMVLNGQQIGGTADHKSRSRLLGVCGPIEELGCGGPQRSERTKATVPGGFGGIRLRTHRLLGY